MVFYTLLKVNEKKKDIVLLITLNWVFSNRWESTFKNLSMNKE